jgi:hypothetical protein
MPNTSRRRHENEDMRTALNRVGAAIDRWYEERGRRQEIIDALAANCRPIANETSG